MIIEMLLNALYSIFSLLTTPINLPSLPNEINEFLSLMLDYMLTGFTILTNYTYGTYLVTLLGIIIAVDIGIRLYHFVMWILRKIPMLNIS